MDISEGKQLVAALAESARDLIGAHNVRDLERTLVAVVMAAVDAVPGAEAGGVSVTEKKEIESRAPYNESVLALDRLQAELGEGPCVSALNESSLGKTVLVEDLAGDDGEQWPAFAVKAERYGYRSMLSTQLSADGGPQAALNLYSSAPGAFDAHSRVMAGLCGVQAALVLYGASHATNLNIALGSRDEIGQAKGILMERFHVTGEHAFQMLVRSSQDTNLKLAEVARWLINEVPGSSPAAVEK